MPLGSGCRGCLAGCMAAVACMAVANLSVVICLWARRLFNCCTPQACPAPLCLTAPIAIPALPLQLAGAGGSREDGGCEEGECAAGCATCRLCDLQFVLLAGCVTRSWVCSLPRACAVALPGTLALCAMRILPTTQRVQLASSAAKSAHPLQAHVDLEKGMATVSVDAGAQDAAAAAATLAKAVQELGFDAAPQA